MRLIDADALMKKVCGNCQRNDCVPDATDTVYGCMFAESVEEAKSFDKIHAKWLSYTGTHYTGKENEYGDPEYKEHIFYECSNCRRKTVVREHFCPNCGAKMSGGDNDAESD